MNSRLPGSGRGFSLTEMMVSLTIGIAVIGGGVSLWNFGVRGAFVESIKSDLRGDLEVSLENIKRDLRATSADLIHYYPSTGAVCEAISFPLAVDSDGNGTVETDEFGHLIWDQTVVYHALRADPTQMRRTVFATRDNTLTDAERRQQLADVVRTGTGAGTYEGASSRTKTLFSNLFDVEISPDGALYDSYAPDRALDRGVDLGSTVLSPGDHTLTFEITGQNEDSSGYRVCLDSLIFGRSGCRFEAEDLIDRAKADGGRVFIEDTSDAGGWSGNRQLVFDGDGEGSSLGLVIHNDAWRESVFHGSGACQQDTTVTYDGTATPPQFVVMLAGNDRAWDASAQTGASPLAVPYDLAGYAVRIPIDGGGADSGGALVLSGQRTRFWLAAHPFAGSLVIREAWLARRTAGPDVDPSTMVQVTFNSSPQAAPGISIRDGGVGVSIPAGSAAPCDWIDFPVSVEHDYALTLLVDPVPGSGRHIGWSDPGTVQSYLVVDGESAVGMAGWSSIGDVTTSHLLPALALIEVTYPAIGTYTSQVFDSLESDTEFSSIEWEEELRGGAIEMRVRAGDRPDLSDAPDWTAIGSMTGGGATHGLPHGTRGRYIQFQAVLHASADFLASPRLLSSTIEWDPGIGICQVVADLTVAPDGAIFEVKVDEVAPTKGVTVALELFADYLGQRYRERAAAEVEPRNSGR